MSVHLIDHSPPNGDYVRYIEALMQESGQSVGLEPAPQESVAPGVRVAGRGRATSKEQGPAQSPGLAKARMPSGPPDLGELWSEFLRRLSGKHVSEGSPAVSAWWPWVAIAVVITGVLFPFAMAPLAIVAFIVWRMIKPPPGKGKGNKP